MLPYQPNQLLIERSVLSSSITRNVLSKLSGLPVRVIDSSSALLEDSKRLRPSVSTAKRQLVLAHHPGTFFKPCPARQSSGEVKNVCCDYFVINFASNCHMECSYCYLQDYLNFPYMVVYANLGDLLQQMKEALTAQPDKFFRIGTGELADSLALDELTGYAAPLVEFFAARKNAILEFKTKSNCVANLLGLRHDKRTVVSWSISPPRIQRSEEHKTATIDQRLEAAQQCAAAGYPVSFHLDPLIFYPEWENEYHLLLEDIFQRVPASSIGWFSLGGLRLTAGLKAVMRRRFPKSLLHRGELVPSRDGKMRYFKPIRVGMFRTILTWIKTRWPATPVYTCMEGPDVWNRVFDGPPPRPSQLNRLITLSRQ